MDFLSKPILTAKDNLLLEKIKRKISGFQNFNIFTHKNPDGDAIGSILALCQILAAKGKTARTFIFDSADERFSFFPNFEKIKIARKPELLDNALIIYVDCSSPARTGFEENSFADKEGIAIDHHLVSEQEDPNVIKIINSAASSTAEVIFDMATQLNWPMDVETSTCLLGGLLADTGSFQHSNTSPKSFRIVSLLIKKGVNLKKTAEQLFKKREFDGSLKIWGKVLSRVSVDAQTKMAFSYVSQDDLKKYNSNEDELSGLINLLAGIPESRFSLLLIETKFGKVRGSMRSELYKGVDVAKIAQAFGGGGHKLAAGFEVEGKIKDKEKEIKEKIAEELLKQ
ncbi:bifunctional oligoribonuclease/PAP phosphatase NrnA [Patescibacteria group bacterium]|nr:bifunctional oligoribonuclease/PAP phosphatase NrnA [Patescibacteria group bacterium]MBU4580103.1 bifunctional oligoribonuclease/PAP phosphatase NrnA [Patescibacteria group bacterium]